MCTFKGERAVVVCDVAIEHVRAALDDAALPVGVTFRAAEGGGTLVEAGPAVGPEDFEHAVRLGIGRTASGQ